MRALAVLGQVTNSDEVTWVGVVSGGLPVAAGAIIIVLYLWRAYQKALERIDSLQSERLADVRELAPLVRDMGSLMTRVLVKLEQQVGRGGS